MKPLFALILTLSTVGLSACGGGGGGSSSSGSSGSTATPVAPASTSPDTSEPAATYTSGDPRLAIYSALNNYRSKMAVGDVGGVGLVGQNSDLDTAAQAHANYLTSSEPVPFEQHNEVSGTPGFTGVTPYDRAAAASFSPASAWIGEAIGDSGSCVSELLDTVYHLQALTSNIEQIGIGYTSDWVCVVDAATITGTAGSTLPASGNGEPIGGGQQLPLGAVAMSPYNGETGVLPAMSAGENPRPVPSITSPGHPVMLRVRADFTTDTLLASSFTLSTNGSPVSGTVLVASNAASSAASGLSADPLVAPGVAFFVPSTPLQSATTYTASFNGSRDGVAVNQTWSFTTQ